MPLFEFQCAGCHKNFEQILSGSQKAKSGEVQCPFCKGTKVQKLISRFSVAGRGDLRESSEFHGCHPYDGLDDHE